jgi:ABC-type transporter Mla maintaining outer membrane lipid asymmetry ATPase subunit MlaF
MVCVTSSIDAAFRFAPDVAFIAKGAILARGNHEELYAHPDPYIHDFLTIRKSAV